MSSLVNGSDRSFTVAEVVMEMRRRGSRYAESTIRTHVTAFMCSNSPINHSSQYRDFERIERGRYRMIDSMSSDRNPPVQVAKTIPIVEVELAEIPAGNSDVQRHAETIALKALSEQIDVELVPERLYLDPPDGPYVEIDGVSHDPRVLVEVWAHQGAPKSAQRNKILSDAFKLQYVNDVLDGNYRLHTLPSRCNGCSSIHWPLLVRERPPLYRHRHRSCSDSG